MSDVIRPVSRLTAVELTDVEIDSVGGGGTASTNANTDVYTRTPKPGIYQYDGSHGGD